MKSSKLLALTLLVAAIGSASADPHRYYDRRYNHNHYYPSVGFLAAALPLGALAIALGSDRVYFQGGVWWRPYGRSYRVFVPPVGAVIPLLPADYVRVDIGGAPYYYANGIYYRSAAGGYVVADAPAGVDATPPAPAAVAAKPEPIIYPRNGQNAQQIEADRRDCNRWATTQPSAMAEASVFERAVEACMDGRGYTMR
ncbi:MAG TPA: DUF6515 family protein [Burkholderiaceae bacterium]